MQTPALTRSFLGFLLARVARLFWGALALSVLVTLTEGVGLLLLLPLLQVAGVETRSGSVGVVTDLVERGLAAAGVPTTVSTVLALFFAVMVLHEPTIRVRATTNARACGSRM